MRTVTIVIPQIVDLSLWLTGCESVSCYNGLCEKTKNDVMSFSGPPAQVKKINAQRAADTAWMSKFDTWHATAPARRADAAIRVALASVVNAEGAVSQCRRHTGCAQPECLDRGRTPSWSAAFEFV